MATTDDAKPTAETAPKKPQWESPELIEISEHAIATCAYGNQDATGPCSTGRGAAGGCSSGTQDD